MVTAAVFLAFSGISAAIALWWRDAPMAALLCTSVGLIALAVGLVVYQSLMLRREMEELEERLQRMAEKRGVKLSPRRMRERKEGPWSV